MKEMERFHSCLLSINGTFKHSEVAFFLLFFSLLFYLSEVSLPAQNRIKLHDQLLSKTDSKHVFNGLTSLRFGHSKDLCLYSKRENSSDLFVCARGHIARSFIRLATNQEQTSSKPQRGTISVLSRPTQTP